MQSLHKGHEHSRQSAIRYLPMRSRYICSGDSTCILYILEFLSNLAMESNLSPIRTSVYDQPLYLIWDHQCCTREQHLERSTLLLGLFQTFMNLLRVIDTLVQKDPNPTSTSTSNFTSTSTSVLVDQDWYHAKGATCNSFLEAVYGECVWYICLH